MPGELIAEKVARRLAAGAPFGPTARRFSMDPETRFEGGLLGWVAVITVPPEVRAALAGLRAGDVTEPVRSSGRWQLFKLFARRPAVVTPFAEAARADPPRAHAPAAGDRARRLARPRAGARHGRDSPVASREGAAGGRSPEAWQRASPTGRGACAGRRAAILAGELFCPGGRLVRNALIVLVVVALVLVALGAVNNGLLFDIDFVAATWTAVSLFWVAVVIAGVVFVTGVAAAFLAASGAVAARRKLEKELQSTYERLRAAEAKLPRPAPAPAVVVDVAPGEHTAVTAVASAPTADQTHAAAAVTPDAETVVTDRAPDADTAVINEATDAETVVTEQAPEAETVAASSPPTGPAADAAAGEAVLDAPTADPVAEEVATAAAAAPPGDDAPSPAVS